MNIEYQASASFDIETNIEVEDDADDLEIYLSIMHDLEDRYGLSVSYRKAQLGDYGSDGEVLMAWREDAYLFI